MINWTNMHELDDPLRVTETRRLIRSKPFLRKFYTEVYDKYAEVLDRCPEEGIALELGSGAGFVKELIPEIITSDVIPYEGSERVIDATKIPFDDDSLRAICMMNVFHHISDVSAFLAEAERCLRPGGRVFIMDQHPGWISTPILKHAHHEPFRPEAQEWAFPSTGPLSDANGALAWIVFQRDVGTFEKKYPRLRLEAYRPHSPVRYWVSGGLCRWSLLPGWAFGFASGLDKALLWLSPDFGSFVDIELFKTE
jgi:SAM-dependent methyltransferase